MDELRDAETDVRDATDGLETRTINVGDVLPVKLVPVLVNTSFNTRGEPIVCTPRDAIECFWTSPLDALVIGSFLLEKPQGRK